MSFPFSQKITSNMLAATICIIAAAFYLLIYGAGAVPDVDTASYVDFVVMRPLGYPIVLWVLQHTGLMPYLGLVQLTLMFAGYLTLWGAARTYLSERWAWLVLGLCLVNIELVKYAFRELPEALFVAALTWHLSALMHIFAGKKLGALLALVVSGALVMLIRPAGLPILLASALALMAYSTPATTLRAVAGFIVLGWLAPTLGNGFSRGIYAPQLYGGFHTVVPVSHAVMTTNQGHLMAPLDGLASDLASLKVVYGTPSWPFEQAIMEALASPYLTLKLAPEFKNDDYEILTKLREANERGRAYFTTALMTLPVNYIEGVSANIVGLLAGPGFVDPSMKAAITERLTAVGSVDPMLAKEFQEALGAQRVIPTWALAIVRIIGVLLLIMALLAGFRLAFDLILRITGRPRNFSQGMVVASLGTMISGYIVMAGLVAPIPRFTLVIFPLLVLFVASAASQLLWKRGADSYDRLGK